jgi:hypothetical protein
MSAPTLDLQPCPFCGGAARLIEDPPSGDGYPRHSVECGTKSDGGICPVEPSTLWFVTPAAAVEAWNTRPVSAPSPVGTEVEGFGETLGAKFDRSLESMLDAAGIAHHDVDLAGCREELLADVRDFAPASPAPPSPVGMTAGERGRLLADGVRDLAQQFRAEVLRLAFNTHDALDGVQRCNLRTYRAIADELDALLNGEAPVAPREDESVRNAFHRAWTAAVGTARYDKSVWMAASAQLSAAAAVAAQPPVSISPESPEGSRRDRVAGLETALRRFASSAPAQAVAREDYTYMRERIVDWFGPSDFRAARQALGLGTPSEDEERDVSVVPPTPLASPSEALQGDGGRVALLERVEKAAYGVYGVVCEKGAIHDDDALVRQLAHALYELHRDDMPADLDLMDAVLTAAPPSPAPATQPDHDAERAAAVRAAVARHPNSSGKVDGFMAEWDRKHPRPRPHLAAPATQGDARERRYCDAFSMGMCTGDEIDSEGPCVCKDDFGETLALRSSPPTPAGGRDGAVADDICVSQVRGGAAEGDRAVEVSGLQGGVAVPPTPGEQEEREADAGLPAPSPSLLTGVSPSSESPTSGEEGRA